jgi:hypothetical protein
LSGLWPFNPFAWQFLFTIGAAVGVRLMAGELLLPRVKPIAWLAVAYLMFAFMENFPSVSWHLPDLRPLTIATPSKANLSPFRLSDILALAYLLFIWTTVRSWAGRRVLQAIDLLGRHSLEVFATGCVAALRGRLLLHTCGATVPCQIVVNALGFTAMWAVAYWADGSPARAARGRGAPASLVRAAE